MKPKNKLVKNFKIHLERLGFSKAMVYQLPCHIDDFLKFTVKEVTEIESEDILNFHKHLQERPRKRGAGGLSESYINHHVYGLKLFFGWQQEKGAILENPISGLEFKKPRSKPREILTEKEVAELFEACETLKQRAVLAIFYGCGLRRSEGEDLDLKDIHFRAGILYVRKGKNSKRRAVPLSKQVKTELWNYAINERKLINNTSRTSSVAEMNETAFVLNQIHKRSSGSTYNKILKSILERTSITKEITLHCLRHSIATHLLDSGLPVEYVRDFLGHKHLESTQIYVRIKNKHLWNLTAI